MSTHFWHITQKPSTSIKSFPVSLIVSCGQASSHLPQELHKVELNTNLICSSAPSAIEYVSTFNAPSGQTSAHFGSPPQVSQWIMEVGVTSIAEVGQVPSQAPHLIQPSSLNTIIIKTPQLEFFNDVSFTVYNIYFS